jgi:hypothetical protein
MATNDFDPDDPDGIARDVFDAADDYAWHCSGRGGVIPASEHRRDRIATRRKPTPFTTAALNRICLGESPRRARTLKRLQNTPNGIK